LRQFAVHTGKVTVVLLIEHVLAVIAVILLECVHSNGGLMLRLAGPGCIVAEQLPAGRQDMATLAEC